jgi:hypothetical protein
MLPAPWFERWPARLDKELQALGAAGIPHRIDEELRARGILVLHVRPTVDSQELPLVAAFPATFPYTRFEIQAPWLDLKHHQHPFSKTLCLIARGTVNWRESDTVAGFLRDRLPRVLQAGRSDERAEVESIEEHQGEPFTDYYDYQTGAMVLMDGTSALDPAVTYGELIVGVQEDAGPVLRGVVLTIRDRSGRVVASADPALGALYPKKLRGRWVRRRQPIRRNDAEGFHAALVSEFSRLARPEWQLVRGWKIDIVGLVFEDELAWRETGDNWIFLVRGEELKDPGRRKGRKYLARAARIGREDLTTRTPELKVLADKMVAVIGLGGLGAPSALEFARVGFGEIRILDGDFVDPGTAVRWPFGLPVAGLPKTQVIKEFISQHYPHVRVRERQHRLGAVRTEPPFDFDVLDEVLDGVALIYDATAEVGIQHLLADVARERQIQYLCVSSTAGAWGGLLIRVRPDQTKGCWGCSQWALMEGEIPSPPADPFRGVQPAGCADPTFTGAGFDLSQVALAGVRLAVGTVTGGVAGAYPDVDWDVAVISLRGRDGTVIAPRWETFALTRHPSCGCAGE